MEKIKNFKEFMNSETLNEKTSMEKSYDMLLEMARINTDETNLFPHNSYEIQIWSNDHMPPHFHILKDGWDVSFLIENGELYKINKVGKNKRIYKYMLANIGKWLSANCAVLPIATNKQNANAIWKQIHR